MSRSRLAGKAIYFVTRAKILEEAASIGNQANCSRFCANLAIAITTAHTKSALAEEKTSGRERDSVERLHRRPHEGGREGVGRKQRRKSLRRGGRKANEISR